MGDSTTEEASVQEPRFDDATRKLLEQKFVAKYQAADKSVSDDGAERSADEFVECLQGFARAWPAWSSQKRRREQVEALANALDAVADAAFRMDDPALGYALYKGLLGMVGGPQFSADDRGFVESLAGYESIFTAYRIQHEHRADIERFCLGVRSAIKQLPGMDKRYCTEFQAAKFIEDYLARRGIGVTTSDTGLAGSAFMATMALAGLDVQRAGYWIKLARDDGDSWGSFMKRLQDRADAEAMQNKVAE